MVTLTNIHSVSEDTVCRVFVDGCRHEDMFDHLETVILVHLFHDIRARYEGWEADVLSDHVSARDSLRREHSTGGGHRRVSPASPSGRFRPCRPTDGCLRQRVVCVDVCSLLVALK